MTRSGYAVCLNQRGCRAAPDPRADSSAQAAKSYVLSLENTDSIRNAGSHLNKGLTELQVALGGKLNSFFCKIVCYYHGYGTCCTSDLFPNPSGYFPFADARISMNLLFLLRPGLGLNSLCHRVP